MGLCLRLLLTAFTFTFLTGCDQLDAKIELRGDEFYIVNTSSRKPYTFTVKHTMREDKKKTTYDTRFVELAPGDEALLGPKLEQTTVIIPVGYREVLDIRDPANLIFRSDGSLEQVLEVELNKKVYTHDTTIKGKKMVYGYISESFNDTANAKPSIRYEHEYQVTGQSDPQPKPKRTTKQR